jgi:hypothetical protein
MIRREQTTTFQERLEITEPAAAGQSDPQIAAALGCSVWTVRKWPRRGHDYGRAGLSSHMRRSTGTTVYTGSVAPTSLAWLIDGVNLNTDSTTAPER